MGEINQLTNDRYDHFHGHPSRSQTLHSKNWIQHTNGIHTFQNPPAGPTVEDVEGLPESFWGCFGDGVVCSKGYVGNFHLSNEKNPGCLGYVGDYTTQFYRDYNKPL